MSLFEPAGAVKAQKMNDVSDSFEIFNGSDDEFPFAQTRYCYLFHIITTFFTNFVDVRLIVGLLVGFALERFWFEHFEVIISGLSDLLFEVRYRFTKFKKNLIKLLHHFRGCHCWF